MRNMYNFIEYAFIIFIETVQYMCEVSVRLWEMLCCKLYCFKMENLYLINNKNIYFTLENNLIFIKPLVLLCYLQRVNIPRQLLKPCLRGDSKVTH